jgi:hypothetical protein
MENHKSSCAPRQEPKAASAIARSCTHANSKSKFGCIQVFIIRGVQFYCYCLLTVSCKNLICAMKITPEIH